MDKSKVEIVRLFSCAHLYSRESRIIASFSSPSFALENTCRKCLPEVTREALLTFGAIPLWRRNNPCLRFDLDPGRLENTGCVWCWWKEDSSPEPMTTDGGKEPSINQTEPTAVSLSAQSYYGFMTHGFGRMKPTCKLFGNISTPICLPTVAKTAGPNASLLTMRCTSKSLQSLCLRSLIGMRKKPVEQRSRLKMSEKKQSWRCVFNFMFPVFVGMPRDCRFQITKSDQISQQKN